MDEPNVSQHSFQYLLLFGDVLLWEVTLLAEKINSEN